MKKNKILEGLLYWFVSGMMLYFVFSYNYYDQQLRALIVIIATVISALLSLLINRVLIPSFLFRERNFLFFYLVLFSFLVTILLNYTFFYFIILNSALKFKIHALPGNRDVLLLLSGSYLVTLFASFTYFTKESNRRRMENERLMILKNEVETKLRETRLKYLKAQIHPHFLFNMLNNVYGLSIEKSPAAPEAILKLSELLEFLLYESERSRIKLSEEVRFINNYVSLEQIRYDNRLSFNITTEGNQEELEIAPLLLFPFVENAFKHSYHSEGGINISVLLRANSDYVLLEVKNSLGENLNRNRAGGIGLKNIEERLKTEYPGRYVLKAERTEREYSISLKINLH
jgi:sensor histidine kinase YesM